MHREPYQPRKEACQANVADIYNGERTSYRSEISFVAVRKWLVRCFPLNTTNDDRGHVMTTLQCNLRNTWKSFTLLHYAGCISNDGQKRSSSKANGSSDRFLTSRLGTSP